MIELEIVGRMVRRGLILAPFAVAVLAAIGGLEWALSGAAGIATTLANLWLAGRIIGGLAENRPDLLQIAALVALTFGLVGIGVVLVALEQVDSLDIRVTGLTLIATHLVLVSWEASDRFLKLPPRKSGESVPKAVTKRS